MTTQLKFALAFSAASVLLYGCGNNDGPSPEPTPPNLAGVWAGTWTGTNTPQGLVTGTWEADLSQTETEVKGAVALRGDIDCMEGAVTGSADASSVAGSLSRFPCQENNWTLTALNLPDRTASGTWTQPANSGQGTFTGRQIAKPEGPRIFFVNPPAGPANTLVTIAATNLGATPADNELAFELSPATTLTTSSAALTTRVPEGASTGPIYLKTAKDTAYSPTNFSVDVGHPIPFVSTTISTALSPGAVAFSPDGRKAYVAARSASAGLINTANNALLRSNAMAVPLYSVVAAPGGRWVYMTRGFDGVSVVDAATALAKEVIPVVVNGVPVNAGGGPTLNPQGLAVSTDGRYLFVSDNRDGGRVVVIDIAAKVALTSFYLGAGWMPLGIAVHPDGKRAYFAFADVTGSHQDVVRVFDTTTMTPTETSVPVGARPTGLAVTPDGAKLYVSNNLDNSVSVINTLASLVIKTVPVGLAPAGVAISADNTRVYVVNNADNTASVISVSSDTIEGGPISVGSGPESIALSPDGQRAYVTNAGDGTVMEIGGPKTLTIAKIGTGIGTVRSTPSGIECGTSCQARFPINTIISLQAIADSGSTFGGWGGNCSSGDFTLTANKSCTAAFDRIPPSSGGGGGGSSGGGGGSSNCFIATAAYGSAMAEEVMTLRRFRDERLLKSGTGREFVRLYYRYSPPIADYIRERDSLRAVVRAGLWPLVFVVKHPESFFGVMLGLALLTIRTRRTNRQGRQRIRGRGKKD